MSILLNVLVKRIRELLDEKQLERARVEHSEDPRTGIARIVVMIPPPESDA